MPELKAIAGYSSPSIKGGIKDYLEKGSEKNHTKADPAPSRGLMEYLDGEQMDRGLSWDYQNIQEKNGPDGIDWAEQMDLTRKLAGNDSPIMRAAKDKYGNIMYDADGNVIRRDARRRYMHYIISPDPRDKYTLQQLRELAMTWLHENFPNYEAVVTCHDDNQSHILHAHICINNTDLETHKTIAAYLTPSRARGINNSLQNLGLERGFSAFTEDHQSMNELEMCESHKNVSRAGDERGREHWRDHTEYKRDVAKSSHQGRLNPTRRAPYTRRERRRDIVVDEIVRNGGTSWVEEIRNCVGVARQLAKNEREFRNLLGAIGITTERSANGDWLYTHPSGGAKKVTGKKLGPTYTYRALRSGFATINDHGSAFVRGYRLYVGQIPGSYNQRYSIASRVYVMGIKKREEQVDVKKVADLFRYCDAHNEWNPAKFANDVQGRHMRKVAASVGIRPEIFAAPTTTPTAVVATTNRSKLQIAAAEIDERLRRYGYVYTPETAGHGSSSSPSRSSESTSVPSRSRGER